MPTFDQLSVVNVISNSLANAPPCMPSFRFGCSFNRAQHR